MTNVMLDSISKGWRVYVGSTEAGEVTDIGVNDLGVERGSLRKVTARVPKQLVTEASDGVVDLRDDASTRALLELD